MQAYYRPTGFQKFGAPRFLNNSHTKVVKLQPYAPAVFSSQEIFLVPISVKGSVNLGDIV